MSNIYKDVIIIGAGVAGMTAALNLKRANLDCLILEKSSYGGQVAFSPKVENFPGFKTISGMDLADNIFDQIMDIGVEFELEDVLSVTKENDLFTVTTDYHTYDAKAVIVAAGVKHRKIRLEHEDNLVGKGLSYCAICDGAFFEGENVVVIGDGNTAMQYALMLANTSPKVTICTLFDRFFGEKIYEDRIRSKENIEVIHNVSLNKFIVDEEENLQGLRFTKDNNIDGLTLETKGVFLAIGQIPNNSFIKDLVDLDKEGYIITDSHLETKTKGLFAIGDCRAKDVRQITTAISDAATASVFVQNHVDK